MELDTGAGVSIISQETFNKHFKGTPLKPSCTRLHTYTGHPVQVTGQFHVQLKYQDQSATLPLLVVEGSGPSLFGRDWLIQVKLDWKKICNIRVSRYNSVSPQCVPVWLGNNQGYHRQVGNEA